MSGIFGGGGTPEQANAFAGWNPSLYQTGIPQDLLNGIVNNGWRAGDNTGATGQFGYQPGQSEITYHPQGQGPGEPYYVYDKNGKYLRNDTGSGVQSYLSGILSVAGAGLGMGALFGGAAGAGGYAAGGYAGGGGAGAGATGSGLGAVGDAGGFVGEGAQSGVPAWDAAMGGASPGVAATGAAGGGLGGTMGQTLAKLGLGTAASGAGAGGGGGGSDGSGLNLGGLKLNDIANLIGGVVGQNQQSNAANSMLDWLKGQQSKIDGLYAPNSPEFNNLWDQMSRTDAAAGRNSQYGPRSVDLAAKIAQIKADATSKLTSSMANPYMMALNQRASSGANITAPLGSMLSRAGPGLTLNSILSALGMGGSSSGPSGADLATASNIGASNSLSDASDYNNLPASAWGDTSSTASGGSDISNLIDSWGNL